MNEEIREQIKLELSDVANKGFYSEIHKQVKEHFDIDIDNDSMFWYDIEEMIVNRIEELVNEQP